MILIPSSVDLGPAKPWVEPSSSFSPMFSELACETIKGRLDILKRALSSGKRELPSR